MPLDGFPVSIHWFNAPTLRKTAAYRTLVSVWDLLDPPPWHLEGSDTMGTSSCPADGLLYEGIVLNGVLSIRNRKCSNRFFRRKKPTWD